MHIVFVGLPGVPYLGRACDPRLANTANLLVEDCDVTIVNRYSSLRKNTMQGIELNNKIRCKEILKRRHTGRLLSLILLVLSILTEPFCLYKIHRCKKIDWLHLYTGHYIDFVLYRLFAKLIGAKIVYEYVEFRSEKGARGLYHSLNNWLCDFKGAKLWDACIAISTYLTKSATKINNSLPVIMVTPLGDFDLFEQNKKAVDISGDYVMFCGSASYFEVIKFIIDSFSASKISKSKKLLLVLAGNDQQVQRVTDYSPTCIVRRRLPYDELVAYYKHAYALMIPLRNTIEDIARFPNKICEYTAARGIIVTTSYGEMKYYFKDGENAVVADDCTVASIASKLDDLEDGKYDVASMRENCFNTGVEYFSMNSYAGKIYKFLNSIK